MQSSAEFAKLFSDNAMSAHITSMKNIISSDDPYIILNVKRDANEDQINHAYKELMLKHHPDKQINKTMRELANEVTKKLNMARDKAKCQLKHSLNSITASPNVDRINLFTNRIMNQVINEIFTTRMIRGSTTENKKLLNLLQSSEAYAFAIVMLWARSVITNEQTAILRRIQAGLAEKTSLMDIINLAQGVQPYLENNDIITKVKMHCLSNLLQTMPMAKLKVVADENLGWNLEISQCLVLIQEITTAYPGIPLIMHDLAFKKKHDAFIGLYYANDQYYLFDPNHISFGEQENLIPLSWEEASKQVISTLYHSDYALTQTLATPPATISFFTLRGQSADHLTRFNSNQISIGQTRLTQWFDQGKFSAEHVLQSIYDGELTGILQQLYLKNPAMFSDNLLDKYLMQALENEHILLALEICQLDQLAEEPAWQWSQKYINQYIKRGHSLKLLQQVLKLFQEKGINLIALADTRLKQNGTPWLDDINKKIQDGIIEDTDSLRQILQLNISLTENQRIKFIRYIAEKIDRLSVDLRINKTLKQLDVASKQKIESELKWLQTLIDFGYHFRMPDGLKKEAYLYLILIKSDLVTLARKYYADGLINIEAKDQNNYTVLNHLTLDKNWSEVRYLIDKGATYSTGQEIKASSIPPFAAWQYKIEILRDLYEEPNRKKLLGLISAEGDLLAAAVANCAMPIINYAMTQEFDKQLINNPIPYLYWADRPDSAKRLLASLSKRYLAQQFQQITTSLYILEAMADVKYITPQTDYSTDQRLLNFLDIKKDKMDTEMAKFGISKLAKLEINNKVIYYSANDELTELLCLYFSPLFIKKCYYQIQSIIFDQANDTVPDLSYCINQLSRLFDISKERNSNSSRMKLIHYRDINYFRYINNLKKFDATEYNNQLPQDRPLLGLKVTYDDYDKVISHIWIDNIQLLGMENFIADDPKLGLDEDRHYLWVTLRHLYSLKAILEQSLDCVFGNTEPINDEIISEIFLCDYDQMRKDLSPQKKFNPLDKCKFFRKPLEKNTDDYYQNEQNSNSKENIIFS